MGTHTQELPGFRTLVLVPVTGLAGAVWIG